MLYQNGTSFEDVLCRVYTLKYHVTGKDIGLKNLFLLITFIYTSRMTATHATSIEYGDPACIHWLAHDITVYLRCNDHTQ